MSETSEMSMKPAQTAIKEELVSVIPQTRREGERSEYRDQSFREQLTPGRIAEVRKAWEKVDEGRTLSLDERRTKEMLIEKGIMPIAGGDGRIVLDKDKTDQDLEKALRAIEVEISEDKSSPSHRLERDTKFIELCRSKILVKDKGERERLTRILAHYLPLLCEKFNVPISGDLISAVRVIQPGVLVKMLKQENCCFFQTWLDNRSISLASNYIEQSFVHEIAHAVLQGNWTNFKLAGTPIFIFEGMAQAGESFATIPDVKTEIKEIAAEENPAYGVILASRMMQFHDNSIRYNVPSAELGINAPPVDLMGVSSEKIPIGREMYSYYSRGLFRFLLETYGHEKLKMLGRHLFFKRDEEQVKKRFNDVYGESFDDLLKKSAAFWCGSEAAEKASELLQAGRTYLEVVKKNFGIPLKEILVGHIFLEQGKYSWGGGEYDVLNLSSTKNQQNPKPDYMFFFVKCTTHEVTVIKAPNKDNISITQFDSLEEALEAN